LDQTKYPELAGQWVCNVGAQWDPSMPRGIGQQAPFIPEYQAILEANIAQLAAGREGFNPQIKCFPGGMMANSNIGYSMWERATNGSPAKASCGPCDEPRTSSSTLFFCTNLALLPRLFPRMVAAAIGGTAVAPKKWRGCS
jgi:hypothetical protein